MAAMHQVYCAICGGPIFSDAQFGKWLCEAILLTSAHKSEDGGLVLDDYAPRDISYHETDASAPSRYALRLASTPHEEPQKCLEVQTVLRFDARSKGSGSSQFTISYSGEEVDAYEVESSFHRKPGPVKGGSPLYIPVHSACLKIAEYFIHGTVRSSTCSPGVTAEPGGINSMEKLWEVLYRRVDVALGLHYMAEEPHRYYTSEYSSSGAKDWESDGPDDKIFESDPMEIPGLTAAILDNLSSLPEEINTSSMSNSMEEVPTRDFENMDLKCEYTHNSRWWCQYLLDKRVFPWLWDLDYEAVICHAQRSYERIETWDFESLVRKLSHARIHKAYNKTVRLPSGLRNRRRIWRLLEEARAGDVEKTYAKNQVHQVRKREREGEDTEFRPLPHYVFDNPPPGFRPFGASGSRS